MLEEERDRLKYPISLDLAVRGNHTYKNYFTQMTVNIFTSQLTTFPLVDVKSSRANPVYLAA